MGFRRTRAAGEPFLLKYRQERDGKYPQDRWPRRSGDRSSRRRRDRCATTSRARGDGQMPPRAAPERRLTQKRRQPARAAAAKEFGRTALQRHPAEPTPPRERRRPGRVVPEHEGRTCPNHLSSRGRRQAATGGPTEDQIMKRTILGSVSSIALIFSAGTAMAAGNNTRDDQSDRRVAAGDDEPDQRRQLRRDDDAERRQQRGQYDADRRRQQARRSTQSASGAGATANVTQTPRPGRFPRLHQRAGSEQHFHRDAGCRRRAARAPRSTRRAN